MKTLSRERLAELREAGQIPTRDMVSISRGDLLAFAEMALKHLDFQLGYEELKGLADEMAELLPFMIHDKSVGQSMWISDSDAEDAKDCLAAYRQWCVERGGVE